MLGCMRCDAMSPPGSFHITYPDWSLEEGGAKLGLGTHPICRPQRCAALGVVNEQCFCFKAELKLCELFFPCPKEVNSELNLPENKKRARGHTWRFMWYSFPQTPCVSASLASTFPSHTHLDLPFFILLTLETQQLKAVEKG